MSRLCKHFKCLLISFWLGPGSSRRVASAVEPSVYVDSITAQALRFWWFRSKLSLRAPRHVRGTRLPVISLLLTEYFRIRVVESTAQAWLAGWRRGPPRDKDESKQLGDVHGPEWEHVDTSLLLTLPAAGSLSRLIGCGTFSSSGCLIITLQAIRA
ncbi:hypothetical protein B0J15DRAFT_129242 [Fusarium solani]|uniref:Secreted protein n=1 Tax=Fusarium solani TaxID=169388 RepID=A0A9P9RDU0_FUSSL|nr:uncharacterized protein B0J15DRAFT_129242 [Fusarium solani]KAH7274420.1 hypothetical protein B0J15DRAFT_129242 [Fusarium solani]